jgi:aryl-alcohol dehydrogenase-like predicted oxidoreductase
MLELVPLGGSSLRVSHIGLGCAGIPNDDDEVAFTAIGAARDLGVNFLDTSDLYGVGQNELMIGRYMKAFGRDGIVLATKVGSMPASYDGPSIENSPEHITRFCEASLQRLGTDYVDVLYLHRRTPEVPLSDSIGAMARLVEAGKARAIGLSEVSADTLRAANEIHPIAAIESEYSLWFREPEKDVLPVCRELGIAFVPFSPLGRSFLTGALTQASFDEQDIRSKLPRFQQDAISRNLPLIRRFQAFAEARGVTAAQVALAWLLAQGTESAPIVPIPCSKRPERIAENVSAAAVSLAPEDFAEIEAIFDPTQITGDRYHQFEAERAGT